LFTDTVNKPEVWENTGYDDLIVY